MIVAIASVRNEADIIAKTITHHLAVGANWVIVSDGRSTDGTADIIDQLDQVTLVDQDGPFDQSVEMMRLAGFAKEMDADWVVPFDADEFWCDVAPLQQLPGDVGKVYAKVYGHATWERRHRDVRRLPKVCFRSATSIEWGNHDAVTPGSSVGHLEIRELQYQSFDHFLAKIDKSAELFASSNFPEMYGAHMRALVAMNDQQREAEWVRLCAIPTVFDPIPYRGAR